jgi:ribosomal protein S18 acetylase RimI-like enzyme
MIRLGVRRATASDLTDVIRLLADDGLGRTREAIPEPGGALDPRYAAAFAAIEADPNQALLVGLDGGELVACCQLTIIPGLSRVGALRGQIESVRVAAAHRNRGIGRQLISHAIEEARRRGCALVQLTTDKTRLDARRFYESLGFIATHEGMKLQL